MQRTLYAIVGAVLVLFLDLCVNLLAGAIQSRSFAEQFDTQSIWLLVSLIVAGLVLGWFFGGKIDVSGTDRPAGSNLPETTEDHITITRLRALLSPGTFRGKGIRLSNSWLIGSKLDIDTRDGSGDRTGKPDQ